MIESKKNRFVNQIFGLYLSRLFNKHFYRIHISGEQNINSLSKEFPTILYANHSNWWDGFVAYFLSSKRWKLDDYLMMDIEQMKKYRFFKYLGVFSVNRANPREAVKIPDYAVSFQNTKRFL
jgi:1-acyl-sn-glycerol-3-phosphate acyltransferase